MKPLFILIFALFAVSSCTSSEVPVANDRSEEVEQQPTSNANFDRTPIDAAAFGQIKGDSIQRLLVQQFCEESRGYQKDIWLGLNKCSWAIEKFRLDENPDIIQRNGDELSIFLPNSEKLSFIHQVDHKDQSVYYQFKKYLPQQNLVMIEKMIEAGCVEHFFIDIENGQQTVLSGVPYFGSTNQYFILNGNMDNCLSTMEYWEFSEGKPVQKWKESLKLDTVKDIKWIDKKSFVVHLINGPSSPKANRYLKYKLH